MGTSNDLHQQLNRLKRENERLQQENRSLSRDLALIKTVAQTVVSEPAQLELAARLAEQVADLVGAERAMVGVVADNAVAYEHVVERGQTKPAQLSFGPGEGIAGWVMTYRRPYLGTSAEVDPHTFQRSALAVPILNHQDFLLGVIECHRSPAGLPFTKTELEQVQTVALQAAPGLERAQLLAQMDRWISSFESLLSFSASLNERLEPEALIQRLVEHAAGFLGAEAGFAGLVAKESLVADHYWQNERWQTVNICWPLDEEAGTPGWVLINQCPYLTNSYPSDRLANPQLAAGFGVTNALCVPIMNAHKVLGVVELHNKQAGREPFTWSDAHFLSSLTNASAIALHNAHLLHRLKTQRSRLQAFAAQNLTLLEDERRRIARELHDEAGQVLIGIKLGLQVLGHKLPPEIPGLREESDRLRRQVNEATTRLREIAATLRPQVLDELGLVAALRHCIAEMQAHTEVKLQLEAVELPIRLPQPVEIACYRLVQEAITNVLRHARADQAWISLAVDSHNVIHLTVRDDGQGFNPELQPQRGLGLLGMRERVAMLNGTFTIESSAGTGTTILSTIPIPVRSPAQNGTPVIQ